MLTEPKMSYGQKMRNPVAILVTLASIAGAVFCFTKGWILLGIAILLLGSMLAPAYKRYSYTRWEMTRLVAGFALLIVEFFTGW